MAHSGHGRANEGDLLWRVAQCGPAQLSNISRTPAEAEHRREERAEQNPKLRCAQQGFIVEGQH